MLTRAILILFYLILMSESVRCYDDDTDYDLGGNGLQDILSRRRRGTCPNPEERSRERFFIRLYYGSKHMKGKTSYVKDNILLYKTVQILGWTIQGKSGDLEGKFHEKPGYMSEYEMYYLPIQGKWTQLKTSGGSGVFTTSSTLTSPTKKTEVTLAKPVVSSVLRFYPKDWEGVPYYKIIVKYCPAPKPTPAPVTAAPTLAPSKSPSAKAEDTKARVAATLRHVKEVIKTEKEEKKLLNRELKRLAKEKKAIEKEIRKKKNKSRSEKSPRRKETYPNKSSRRRTSRIQASKRLDSQRRASHRRGRQRYLEDVDAEREEMDFQDFD